jgi:hypothetical protein
MMTINEYHTYLAIALTLGAAVCFLIIYLRYRRDMAELLHLPDDVDPECVPLCDALNAMPYIVTTSSCCGHSIRPFRVFFETKSFKALAQVAYHADSCHSGGRGWQVIANTDCSAKPHGFLLEGPKGDYDGANRIAEAVRHGLLDEPQPQAKIGRHGVFHDSAVTTGGIGSAVVIVLAGLAWLAYNYNAKPKPIAVAAQPVAPSQPVAPATYVLQPVTAISSTLEIIPQERCWIQRSKDDAPDFARVLDKDQHFHYSFSKWTVIRDGCPGKLTFKRDGQIVHPTPEPGHKEDVEVVRLGESVE